MMEWRQPRKNIYRIKKTSSYNMADAASIETSIIVFKKNQLYYMNRKYRLHKMMKIQLRVLVRSRLKSVSDMRTTGCIVWVNEMISQLCCCGFTVLFNYCKYSYFDIWNTWSRLSYDFLSFFTFFLSLSLNLFHITCDYLSVLVSLCLSLSLSVSAALSLCLFLILNFIRFFFIQTIKCENIIWR